MLRLIKKQNSGAYMHLSSNNKDNTEKQNSGTNLCLSSIAHVYIVNRFLKDNKITPLVVKRRPDTVEARANIVDDCVEQLLITTAPVLSEPEEITPDTNIGNNRTQSMQYITVEDLIKCIANGEKASTLRNYAMDVIAAIEP